MGVDVVIGIEARGFIFAPALAYALGAGFVPVRKPKKLPAECARVTYDLEYGTDTLEVHQGRDSAQGRRVLIVDDLLATGGTAKATTQLVEELGRNCCRRWLCGGTDVPGRARKAQRLRRLFPAPVRQMKTAHGSACRALRQAQPRAARSLQAARRVSRAPHGFPDHLAGRSIWSMSFTAARTTRIEIEGTPEIPDNLVERAARLVLEALSIHARCAVQSEEEHSVGRGPGRRIVRRGGSPAGAAGSGGKSDPAGGPSARASRRNWAATFRSSCTAEPRSGLGRGEELYPLPDLPADARSAGGAGHPFLDRGSLPGSVSAIDINSVTK